MRGVARFVVVLIVALVVPFKGLAAVAMIGCGPDHGAALASIAADASHHHHDRGDHHHDHGGEAPDPLTATCSSCAPCCAAVAPAADIGVVPAAPPAGDGAAWSEVHYAGVVADVPHEPPRSIRP